MSQRELAAAMVEQGHTGFRQPTIRRIELLGSDDVPSADTRKVSVGEAVALSMILDVRLETMLEGVHAELSVGSQEAAEAFLRFEALPPDARDAVILSNQELMREVVKDAVEAAMRDREGQ